ncbi:MAG: ABC transporter ATP-binding protein [Bacteroidota bacterium]
MLLKALNLSKSFQGGKVKATQDVSFELQSGNIYAFLGESGSGKTTLARLIAGLERPDAGELYLNERLISSPTTHLPVEKRAIGFVFQQAALFPHLTVAENIAYGIARSRDKKDRVQEMLALVNLEGYDKRYPHELSGGQQQRVALARAMAPKPHLVLLDEPFSSLDTTLRYQVRTELFQILRKSGTCAIFITHNAEDAMLVADEILVFKEGNLIQQSSPETIYQRPASVYVASFFGPIIAMTDELLHSFCYSGEEGVCYYLRDHNVCLTNEHEFKAKAVVEGVAILGKDYLVSLRIDHSVIQVASITKPTKSELTVSFSAAALLSFKS